MTPPQEKKHILLTGASGFLGWNTLFVGHQQHHFDCISLNNPVPFKQKQVKCDLSKENELTSALKKNTYNAIMHFAAISDPNTCQEQASYSKKVNVEATKLLCRFASDQNIPFIFASSDLVFDGKKGDYTEQDPPNPVSHYGEHKAIAEQLILELYPEKSTVCRVPLLFGEGDTPKNALYQIITQLKNNKQLNLFTDEYRTPARAKTIAEFLLSNSDIQPGLLHLGGKEKVSRADMGFGICETFGYNESLIHTCLQSDVKMSAPRPKDVSLNSLLATSQGYQQPSFKTELESISDFLKL